MLLSFEPSHLLSTAGLQTNGKCVLIQVSVLEPLDKIGRQTNHDGCYFLFTLIELAHTAWSGTHPNSVGF